MVLAQNIRALKVVFGILQQILRPLVQSILSKRVLKKPLLILFYAVLFRTFLRKLNITNHNWLYEIVRKNVWFTLNCRSFFAANASKERTTLIMPPSHFEFFDVENILGVVCELLMSQLIFNSLRHNNVESNKLVLFQNWRHKFTHVYQ